MDAGIFPRTAITLCLGSAMEIRYIRFPKASPHLSLPVDNEKTLEGEVHPKSNWPLYGGRDFHRLIHYSKPTPPPHYYFLEFFPRAPVDRFFRIFYSSGQFDIEFPSGSESTRRGWEPAPLHPYLFRPAWPPPPDKALLAHPLYSPFIFLIIILFSPIGPFSLFPFDSDENWK